MVMGKQLAARPVATAMPLPLDCSNGRIAWHQVGSPVRIRDLLRAAINAWAPVGYEDETGFHYGVDGQDWSFSI